MWVAFSVVVVVLFICYLEVSKQDTTNTGCRETEQKLLAVLYLDFLPKCKLGYFLAR